MAGNAPQTSNDLKIQPRDVPTFFADGAVGSAFAGGAHRILLAEFVVDPTLGAEIPGIRHVLNLVIPTSSVAGLIKFLQEMPGFNADGG